MAGDAVVGALRIVLGMDTGSLEDGIKSANSALSEFAKGVAAVATGIGLEKAVEKVAGSFSHLVKSGFETADSLGKLSQKIGVPVEELSGLKLAAELSDLSLESLAKGMKNLAVAANVAATGGVSPAVSALQTLGVKTKDVATGQIRPMSAILLDVADKFHGMEDGATKTALAAAIFGNRIGTDLLPFLNQGRSAIQQLTDEARKMGLVISTETAKSAEEFNDNLKKLSSVGLGVALQVTAAFADSLAGLTKKLVEFVNSLNIAANVSEVFQRAVQFISDNMENLNKLLGIFIAKLVIETIINFGLAMLQTAIAIGKAVAAFSLMNIVSALSTARIAALTAIVLFMTGNLPSFTEQMSKAVDIIAKFFPKDTSETIINGLKDMGFNTDALEGKLNKLKETAKGTSDELPKVKPPPFDPKASDEAKKFSEHLLQIKIQAQAVSGAFAGLAPNFVQTALSLGLIKANGEGMAAALKLATPEARALNAALLELKANQIVQENLTPWDAYRQKITDLQTAFAGAKDHAFEFNQAAQKAAVALVDAYGTAAQNIVGPMASAFKTLAEQNKKYAGIAKALAIAEAIVNTFVAANKALISPFGPVVGIAQAAVVTAAGLANVAKISSTQFAQGGSFRVGGRGGIDSQMIAFRATPGEMVDVRTPGQQTTTTTEVVLRGTRPSDLFTRDTIATLIDGLNQAHRDGYKLRFAS